MTAFGLGITYDDDCDPEPEAGAIPSNTAAPGRQQKTVVHTATKPVNQIPNQQPGSSPALAALPIQRPSCSVDAYQRAYRTKLMTVFKYIDSPEVFQMIDQVMNITVTTNSTDGPKTIPLINDDNDSFQVPVFIGNGQKFSIDVDTGSSDTWFRGPGCTSKEGPCKGTAVDVNDTSIDITNKTFHVTYAYGKVAAQVAFTNVSVGGTTPVLMPIGISIKQNGLAKSDGILGLGFDELSTMSRRLKTSANYMDLFHNSTGAPSSIAFHLSPDPEIPGSILFGAIDQSKFKGPFTTVSVNSELYWQMDFSNSTFQIGGGPAQNLSGRFANAVVDSGTSLMILDSKIADDINIKLGAVPTNSGDGLAKFANCRDGLRGPTFTMNVAGVDYPVPPSIYVVKNSGECFSGFAGMGSTPDGELIADTASDAKAILGGTFMKSVYVNFDKSNKKMQFARSINTISQLKVK